MKVSCTVLKTSCYSDVVAEFNDYTKPTKPPATMAGALPIKNIMNNSNIIMDAEMHQALENQEEAFHWACIINPVLGEYFFDVPRAKIAEWIRNGSLHRHHDPYASGNLEFEAADLLFLLSSEKAEEFQDPDIFSKFGCFNLNH